MPDLDEMLKKRIVYSIPKMEQVQVQKNISYKTVDDTDLKMDVYYPHDLQSNSRRPAVILVHGEGVDPAILKDAKDWGVFVSFGQLIAASGLIAIPFNHRSTEDLTRYEAASDVDDLITYVRDHAESLHIDKEHLCLWAISAGVPTGMRAAMREPHPFIRCIVAYYGPMDLQHVREFFEFFPSEVTDETLREFSAISHLEKNSSDIPPMFIAKAGLDHPFFNESIDRFVMEASSKNVPITFMNHPTGHHAFDMLDDNARSREIIRNTLEFIKEHLKV